MSSPQPDVAFQLAEALLGHMMVRLLEADNPPARSFISDGVAPPGDDCCAGIAWVRVATVIPTDGDGNAYRVMLNSPAGPWGHSIFLEAGVLRCTPVLDEQGNPPPDCDYTAAALLAASDRQALRMALICDLPANIIAAGADGQIPGNWTPIDAGGCGGGYITTQIGTTLVI